MSSPGYPSLEIERRAGGEYAIVASVLLVLAVVPWLITAVPAAAALSLGCCSLGFAGFRRVGWLGGQRALRAAVWTSEGEWRLIDTRGRAWTATLQGGSWVSSSVIWLRFQASSGVRQLLLVGPGDHIETFRRLVARLRLTSRDAHSGSANT